MPDVTNCAMEISDGVTSASQLNSDSSKLISEADSGIKPAASSGSVDK
jgi:hypothetical protein